MTHEEIGKGGYGENHLTIGRSARDHWVKITPAIETMMDDDTPVYTDEEGRFIRLSAFISLARRKPTTGVR